MAMKITREMIEKQVPYHQYTLRRGEWCSEVDVKGLSEPQWNLLYDRLNHLSQVIMMSRYFGCIVVRTTGQAQRVARFVERIGGQATIARGKATFNQRSYYDDLGYDFVEVK